ncbi:MAG: DUF2914 domain-containing protein [Candidatus Thiodiazotropha sp. LLP2]
MAKHTKVKDIFNTSSLLILPALMIPSILWSQDQGEFQAPEPEASVVTDQAIQEAEEITHETQELLDTQGIEESPVPDAYVARAVFTTDIENREPVDQVVSLNEDATRVLFFTDLRNLQGRTVTHRWEFEGEVISEVDIEVGGPRWRAYSVKSLNPGEGGKWTVFVIDESGWPLHASIFQQRAGSLIETVPLTQE